MANMYDKPVNLDFINTYVSPDFNMLMKSGAAMQGRADQAELTTDQMQDKLLQVNALNEDKAQRDRLTAEYEDAVSKKLEEVGGSYYKMAPFIKEQRKKLHRDLTRGTLGKVQQNYDSYGKWYNDTKERVLAGDVSRREFDIANAKIRDEYKGVGTPEDLQSIQTMDLVNQYNYGELALEIAGNIKGSSYTSIGEWMQGQGIEQGDIPTYMYSQRTTDVESLSKGEIDAVVKAAIKTNPVYADHLKQRGDLLMWDHERKLKNAGSDLVKERGGINEDDAEIMKTIDTLDEEGNKRKLDPNNPEDVETYARMLKRQEFQYDLVDNAAAVAAETFDYQKVKQSSKTMTDQRAVKEMTDKMDAHASAFVSTVPGEKTNINLTDLSVSVNEAKESLNTQNENLEQIVGSYNFEEILRSESSRQYGGETGEVTLQEIKNIYDSDLNAEGPNAGSGREMLAMQIAQKEGLLTSSNTPSQEAYMRLDALINDISGSEVAQSKIDQTQGIIDLSLKEITDNIPKADYTNTYNEYTKSVSEGSPVISQGQMESLLASSNTIEELQDGYQRITGLDATFEGAQNRYNRKRRESKKSPSAHSGYSSTQGGLEAEKKKGYYGFKKIEKMFNATKEKVEAKAKGVTIPYTKIDLVAEKGVATAIWNEFTTAEEALKDPTTKIHVGEGANKKSFSISEYLKHTIDDDDIDYSKLKIVARQIGGKGLDGYNISATYDGKTYPTFTANIPGRKESNRLQTEKLIDSPDKNVAMHAKSNLAIDATDNWNLLNATLLEEGQDMPLSVRGDMNYALHKENGRYYISYTGQYKVGEDAKGKKIKVANISGESTPITSQYGKATDAMADFYDKWLK